MVNNLAERPYINPVIVDNNLYLSENDSKFISIIKKKKDNNKNKKSLLDTKKNNKNDEKRFSKLLTSKIIINIK